MHWSYVFLTLTHRYMNKYILTFHQCDKCQYNQPSLQWKCYFDEIFINAVLEVAQMITSSAASDENFV